MSEQTGDGFKQIFMTLGLETLHACYETRETLSSSKMKNALPTMLREPHIKNVTVDGRTLIFPNIPMMDIVGRAVQKLKEVFIPSRHIACLGALTRELKRNKIPDAIIGEIWMMAGE